MATLQSTVISEQNSRPPSDIAAPAATAWPLVLAFGFTLIFAGLLTSASVSVLGAVLTVAGCVGWFREVLPSEHEVELPVTPDEFVPVTSRRAVDRLPVAPDQVRAWLPLHTHPITAGLKGGLAGGVAMALLACAYGVVKAGSIWYPINLLAASVYAQSLKLGASQLNAFHPDSFAIALGLHALISDDGRAAVWRNASDVRETAHPPRRIDRSCVVVGAPLFDTLLAEPSAREPHRLAVVHGIAGGFRHRRRIDRGAAAASADTREHRVCDTRGG